jgi:hypothetical protein
MGAGGGILEALVQYDDAPTHVLRASFCNQPPPVQQQQPSLPQPSDTQIRPPPPVQHAVLVQVGHRLRHLHKDGRRLLLAVRQPQLVQVVNHLAAPV